ncbi:MAG: hypothetical protein IPL61_26255 [Myxococcales bacterium]|nr:hypothetical protein [Myxococcales bacterium]
MAPPGVPTLDPDLALLLATERRLEDALAQARADADAGRAAAVAAIATADADAERELEAARGAVADQVAGEAGARSAAIEAAARAEVASWTALEGTALTAAADQLRTRLGALIVEAS